jgi:hypothetical protein
MTQNCHFDGNLETQGNALIFKIIRLVRVLFETSEIDSGAPRLVERETIFDLVDILLGISPASES